MNIPLLTKKRLLGVVGVGCVRIQVCSGREIQWQTLERPDVGFGSWSEHSLHRFAGRGDEQMHSQTEEVAPLAGDVAPMLLALIDPASGDAIVVADGDGHTVDDI